MIFQQALMRRFKQITGDNTWKTDISIHLLSRISVRKYKYIHKLMLQIYYYVKNMECQIL